jgi:deoxycytidylate deaminase
MKSSVFLHFASELSKLSKCKHGGVAAILVSTDFTQIFAIGINGGPVGQMQCCCGDESAKYGCAHAEQNCLIKNTDKTTPKIMICTKQCCPTCATLIVNSKANIKEFWFIDSYKDSTGLKILENADIQCRRYSL